MLSETCINRVSKEWVRETVEVVSVAKHNKCSEVETIWVSGEDTGGLGK